MSWGKNLVPSLLMMGALLLPVTITSCAVHAGVGYRVYDPYYEDYHVWGPGEAGYYNQWVIETHRPHREFRRLNRNEQREYFNWRHSHHPERERERR